MPLVKQRDLLLMGNFSFQVNRTVKHDMWFNNAPWGPADSWGRSFIEIGEKAGAKTIALLAADQEFAQNLAKLAKERRRREEASRSSSSRTIRRTRWSSPRSIRALRAAKPDMVFVCSYPPDSVGIVRAVNEIGVGDNVKIFGGGMVGLQFTAVMESLGSLLNGVVNYNSWLPEPTMFHDGTKEFFAKYQPRAVAAKVDPLGYYLPPLRLRLGPDARAGGQRDQVARPEGARRLPPHERDEDHRRHRSSYAADGEWEQTGTVQAQFRGVVDKNIEQFRGPGKQVILSPDASRPAISSSRSRRPARAER